MDPKGLRPERFSTLPNTSGADKAWLHWKHILMSCLASRTQTQTTTNADGSTSTTAPPAISKLDILVNHVTTPVYDFFSECEDFESAIETLESLYVVPKNVIFARHLLSTRKQQPGESLDAYLSALKILAKDCQFGAVSAEQYKQEKILEAFINGLEIPTIRQRLLENTKLPTLNEAFTQARSLELAQKTSEHYSNSNVSSSLNATHSPHESSLTPDDTAEILAATSAGSATGKQACYF